MGTTYYKVIGLKELFTKEQLDKWIAEAKKKLVPEAAIRRLIKEVIITN